MALIKDVKSLIESYKSYKQPNRNTSMSIGNLDGRNLFDFAKLQLFSRKYHHKLYNHFGVRNDLEQYIILINFFGEENLKKALDNPNLSTAQIADVLITPENIDAFNDAKKDNALLRIMSKHILFNRVTGLDLSSLEHGISPEYFIRKCYSINEDDDRITLLKVWEANNITKNDFKEIFDIYGDEIVSQYNSDMDLRNQTILVTDEKYSKEPALGGLQDHLTYYSEEDFKDILNKYFNNEGLKEHEKYILIGLLAKITDLIALYSMKNLKEHIDYIKSEIRLGIFQDIVVANKHYTNDDRKRLVNLAGKWNDNDLARYNNLPLLKERLSSIYKGVELDQYITSIDSILSKTIEETVKEADSIKEFMDSLYLQYEVDNREHLIEKVYNPENQEIIIIDDLDKMDSAPLLHFFDSSRKVLDFNSYIKKLEEERSKELGKKFVFSDEEKEKLKFQYLAKENHYITDQSIDVDVIGQISTYDRRYVTNLSNQLSTLIVSPKDILEGNHIRGGNLALRIF